MSQSIPGSGSITLNSGASVAASPAQFDNSTQLASTAFVQRALGSLSGNAFYSANATLTASDIGKSLFISAACTLTLPTAATLPPGSLISVWSGSTTIIQRSGSELIGGSASVTLGPGDTAFLRSDVAGSWLIIGGSMALAGSSAFGSSLVASGYQKLPSGLIIQWGTLPVISASGTVQIAYPIAFPNNILSISGTAGATGGGTGASISGGNGTGGSGGNAKTGCSFSNSSASAATLQGTYIVLGY